jgi:hypothetical protein
MSNPSFNFNAPVGQVNTGNITVTGDNIGTQNNYYGADPEIADLAQQLDDLAQTLQDEMKLDPSNESDLAIAAEEGKKEIEKHPTLKDRLIAALKAGAFETIKQYAKHPIAQILAAAFKAAIETK